MTNRRTRRPSAAHAATCLVAALATAVFALPANAAPNDGASRTARTNGSPKPTREADRLRTDAAQHFAAGDYEDAIRGFKAAHAASADPTDLYNLGRIYEEVGDLATALDYYEQFVGQPHLSLEERRQAAERVEVLRVLVNPDADEPQTASTPVGPTTSTMRDDPRAVGRPLVISGSVLLGVGIALAAGGGIGFGLQGRRARDKIEGLESGSNPDRLSLADAEKLDAEGRDADVLQTSFLVGGSIIALAGAALLTVGLVRRKKQRAPSFTAAIGRQQTTLTATWRF